MDKQKIGYTEVLRHAIEGIKADADELKAGMKLDDAHLKLVGAEAEDRLRESESGFVSVNRNDLAVLKIGAALGLAVEANNALDDGDLLYAATIAILGQKFISSAAGVFLGVQIGANPAIAMAKRRHAENYALTDEAVKYWQENIDPTLSASKAANELLRVVPLSHKKLAEVISAEKKKRS
ncbi:MAG: hypothetical protein Q7N95_04535 [Alphaproteobacteria bacterium]|nr:hypothetical protein [Alphaproteobacteria bacterium]